jgi:Uncharacterized conserved protein
MLQFKKLQLSDIELLRPYFADGSLRAGRNCDCTVGGTFMWRDYFHTEFAFFNQSVVFKAKYFGGVESFSMPLCGGGCRQTLAAVAEYAKAQELPLAFCAVAEEDFPLLREVFGDLDCVTDHAWSDYVYDTCDLATLAGRRYSGQRNHINKFRKLYPCACFEDITDCNCAQAAEFIRCRGERSADISPLAHEEAEKAAELADNFALYKPLGGIIRVNGSVAAAAYGEIIGETLFVHVEKADLAYEGIYPVMVQAFSARYAGGKVKFINREEDDGVDGLRTVKLSYHPVKLIDKYLVRVNI